MNLHYTKIICVTENGPAIYENAVNEASSSRIKVCELSSVVRAQMMSDADGYQKEFEVWRSSGKRGYVIVP